MKILQINAVYGKFSTGRMTKEMHEFFLEHGHASYVASPDLGNLSERCYKIGCIADRKLHAVLSRVFGLQGYYSVLATKKLLRYIESIKPDVIHLGNLHGNYLNLPLLFKYIAERKIPTVVTLHDAWVFTGKCMHYLDSNCEGWLLNCGHCPALRSGIPSYIFDRTEKMLNDKRNWFSAIPQLGIIGVSEWIADDARRSILRDAAYIGSIYNWIDLDVFRPNKPQSSSELITLGGKVVLLGVAMSWSNAKGIDIFNELAELLDENYAIVLIGKIPSIRSSKIIYAGEVSSADLLAKYYCMADMFINPTLRETFGLTNAEAMACGTPVVAYRTTAIPEILGDDGMCGEIVEKRETKEFLNAIERIAKKGKAFYSANCRYRAEMFFSKNRNINSYLEVYERLIIAHKEM